MERGILGKIIKDWTRSEWNKKNRSNRCTSHDKITGVAVGRTPTTKNKQ